MPRAFRCLLPVALLLWFALTGTSASVTAQDEDKRSLVWEPSVVFSAGHEETCLLKVGDEFPATELPNLAGDSFDLGSLADNAMTVIAFWNEKPVAGVQLCHTIVRQLGTTEVGLISIYVGEDAQYAQRIVETDADGKGTHLTDKGDLWNQVATNAPPRVFLLQGRNIVWMDTEYSLATQRELLNAVKHFSASASQ